MRIMARSLPSPLTLSVLAVTDRHHHRICCCLQGPNCTPAVKVLRARELSWCANEIRRLCNEDNLRQIMASAMTLSSAERKLLLMKKVRYVTGALGALGMLPATGLAAPAAGAATTHPPATAGKSVRQPSHTGTTSVPCFSSHKHTSATNIRGYISYDAGSGCIGFVLVHRYNGHPRGELARVRFYSPLSPAPHSTFYLHGTIHSQSNHNSISFKWNPYINGVAMACEAIVHSSTSHKLIAGPVCQTTGY